MIRQVPRYEVVLIDARNLRRSMTYKRHTLRSLANEVSRELRKSRDPEAVKAVSKSTIGHLTGGVQKVARPEVAAAIEEVLDVAPGTLFTQRVSTVSREGARHAEAGMVNLLTMCFGLAFAMAALVAVWFLAREMAAVTDYMEQLDQVGQWLGGLVSAAAVVVTPHQVLQRLTPAQAATVAQRSTDTIYTALEDGTLHGSQRCKRGRWSIRPECLDAYLDAVECEHQKAGAA